MPTCFIICPIGVSGSETRMHADDLFEEIGTALEPFGISAMRGDHNLDTKQVDADIIERIQNAELCIADLSEDNVNVYYELGRRDETGKPIILVRRHGLPPLPVDIAGRRYIEYEIETRRGARLFRDQLREAIKSVSSTGFEGENGNATLAGVYQVLQRVERKIDRMAKAAPAAKTAATPEGDLPEGLSPRESFRLALKTDNIPLAEAAMDRLQWTTEKNRFYDIYVEQAASMGSLRATDMLFAYAQEFFDSDMGFKQKVEYLGALVGCANRTDRELEIKDLVERAAQALDLYASQTPSEDIDSYQRAQVFNQLNRLYYGIYCTTGEESYVTKAVEALKHAITFTERSFLYYNLAMCEQDIDLESARRDINRCLELDGDEVDDDHIELACKIYYRLDDPAYDDLFELLQQVTPQKALLLSR